MATTPNVSKLYFRPGDLPTVRASATITGKTFIKTVPGGSPVANKAVTTCVAGDRPDGVAQNSAATGQALRLLSHVWCEVTAGEALTDGDLVAVGANGRAVKANANPAFGKCLADTASGAGAPINLFV